MTARMVSMQPAAVRKRRQREKERARTAPPVTPPALSSVPLTAVPPAGAPTPAAATADVTRDVTPIASSSSVRLLETEVVTGPGADAFAGETVLGAGDDGHGGTPLVTPEPPPPKPTTTPDEAALIGKAVGAYVGFGWGLMAAKHQDKLAGLAHSLLRGRPELDRLTPEQKFAFGFQALVGMVEHSATNLALKYNVRIPYQDESIVGVAVGTATLGIIQEFKPPKNDNRPRARSRTVDVDEEPRDVTPRPSARAAQGEADRVDLDERPSARATSSSEAPAELVL